MFSELQIHANRELIVSNKPETKTNMANYYPRERISTVHSWFASMLEASCMKLRFGLYRLVLEQSFP
jgi:hypothetical protein